MGQLTAFNALPYGSAIGNIPDPQPRSTNLLLDTHFPETVAAGGLWTENGVNILETFQYQWDAGFVPVYITGDWTDINAYASNSSVVAAAATIYTVQGEFTVDSEVAILDENASRSVRFLIRWTGGVAREDYIDFNPSSGLVTATSAGVDSAQITPFSALISNDEFPPLTNGVYIRILKVSFTTIATPALTTAGEFRIYPQRLTPFEDDADVLAGGFQVKAFPVPTAFQPTNRVKTFANILGQIPRQNANIAYAVELLTASQEYEAVADNGKVWRTTTAGITITLGNGIDGNVQPGENITIVNDSAGNITITAANSMSLIYPGVLSPAVNNSMTLGTGNRITFFVADGQARWEALSAASVSSVTSNANGETPTGAIDGANVTYTLAAAPSPALSLQLFLNRVLMVQGTDYTLAGNTITYTGAGAPQVGDVHRAWYSF